MKSGAALFVIISLAAIAAAATLVYVSTWSDAFIADDWGYLLHSKNLAFSTFLRNCSFTREDYYYRPVAIGYYYLNYALWGLEPTGYHVVKGLLFAAAAALLFVFVLRATGLKIAALAAGLVFALHPLNTECGVWLATHANVLCAFFYLLALILFVEARKRERFHLPLYAGFLLSMLLCFGSYELGYTLPVALILTEILLLWRKRGESAGNYLKKALRAHVPYLVLAGAFLALRLAYMGVDFPKNPTGEVRVLPAAMMAFMPVSEMEFNTQFGIRLLPALAGLAFFAAVLIFGRGMRRMAIFGVAMTVVGVIPVLEAIDLVPAFGHIRFLIVSMMGFGILIGSYVSLLWRWRAGRVVGAVFLAALLAVYWWLGAGQREKWSLAAAHSDAIIKTVTEARRNASSQFRIVFLTYPAVRGVINTEMPFVIFALLMKDPIQVERRFIPDSSYGKVPFDIKLQTPEARKELIRWLPVRLGSLDLYNSGVFDPSEKVYEIPRQDLDKTFFFYWDDEGRRLINCTDAMRKRLAEMREKPLFAWSASEKIPAGRISFISCEWRQATQDAAVYISPVRGGPVPPLVEIALENTACKDFDVVEIDLSALSKFWREGYFTGSVGWLLKDEAESAEVFKRGVKFDGIYHTFHDSRHIFWIPLAQKFLAYDGRNVVKLFIVLPPEVKEYALRSIKLRRLDE